MTANARIMALFFVLAAGCGRAHDGRDGAADPPVPDAGFGDAAADARWADAHVPPADATATDASPTDAIVPPPDGGPPPAVASCTLTAVEDVGSGTGACDRGSLTRLPGGELAMAWSHYREGGKLARRDGDGRWAVEAAFGDARRIQLSGVHAAVERTGGDLSLWEVSAAPRLLERLSGVHTLARARGLLEAGAAPHLLSVHTHEDDGFTWSVHLTTFEPGARTWHVEDARSVAAWDLATDRDGRATLIFESFGFTAIPGIGRIPLPEGARLSSTYVDALHAHTPERGVRVVARQSVLEGSAVIVARMDGTRWAIDELVRDDSDSCDPSPEEGDTCLLDRRTHPIAAILPATRPRVAIAERHDVGTLTWTCDFEAIRDIPCAWEGTVETANRLLIADEVRIGEWEVGVLEGLDLAEPRGLGVHAEGDDVHLAVTDVLSTGGDPDCRLRHVALTCGSEASPEDPEPELTAICTSVCENAACGIPWGEVDCVDTCRTRAADCSVAERTSLSECAGLCDSLYPCVAGVTCAVE